MIFLFGWDFFVSLFSKSLPFFFFIVAAYFAKKSDIVINDPQQNDLPWESLEFLL